MDPLQKQRSQQEVEVKHFYNVEGLKPNMSIYMLFLNKGKLFQKSSILYCGCASMALE